MKKIALGGKRGRGRFTIVDDDDFIWLLLFSWHVNPDGYVVTTASNKPTRHFKMHRLVNNTPPGMTTDHINRNKLDNRKSKLQTATRSQQQQNQKIQWGQKIQQGRSSKYKGVCFIKKDRKSRWQADIRIHNKSVHIGTFKDEIEAAKAYDRMAVELFGEFANTNF